MHSPHFDDFSRFHPIYLFKKKRKTKTDYKMENKCELCRNHRRANFELHWWLDGRFLSSEKVSTVSGKKGT